jgi:glycosyltransferase involved in cell wall biosynthesis
VKIVFVGPFGLQPKGTMSVRALPLARALTARGHQLTVFIPPWDDPQRDGQSWDDNGVKVININLPPGLPLLFHILLTRTLVARILAVRPDVVHCFKPKAYAGLAHLTLWWLRRLGRANLRLVVDADDWEQAWNDVLPYSPAQKRFFAWQEQWGLRQADAVTVASRALKNLVLSQRGGDSSGVVYLPNGVTVDQESQTAESPIPLRFASGTIAANLQPPTILLYSRFLEFRLERIVALVQRVANLLPQTRWLVVGAGLQGQDVRLKNMLAQAGLTEYTHFTGWLPAEQLPAHFAAADVAVFPYDDTLLNRTKCSVKLIDLLAAGLPVVADAVGQNNEYIQTGQTGVLTPAEDDAAMAAALVTLLQNASRREKLGRAARQYLIKNFSWPYLAQVVEQAYRC